jgi:Flp pilus assembly protein TadB
MKYVKYLLAAIGLLLGGFFFQRSKRKSAEALLENQESKEQVQAIEAEKHKTDASLQLEEERREDIKENAENEKAKPVIDSDLLDFLNGKK